jgi:hypothetical protein
LQARSDEGKAVAQTILSCLGLGLATAVAAGAVASLTGYSSPKLLAAGTAVAGGVAGNLATELCQALRRPVTARIRALAAGPPAS